MKISNSFKAETIGFNIMLLGTMVLLIVNAWFLNVSFREVRSHQDDVRHTYEVISAIDSVFTDVKDAESSMRGFLLTKQEEFLAPYRQHHAATLASVQQLKNLTKDNPAQQVTIIAFEKLVLARLDLLESNIELFKKGLPLRELVSLLEQGRSISQSMREYMLRIRDEEERLLRERRSALGRTERNFWWSLLGTTALSVLVIGTAAIRFRQNQLRTAMDAEEKARDAEIRAHIAKVSQLVAGDVGLRTVGQNVLQYLSEIMNITAANLYVYENDALKHVAGFASGLKAGSDVKAPEFLGKGQNLLSEAAQKKQLFEVTNIPDGYLEISSSLGRAKPNTLTFLPFEFQGMHLGAIEMASFDPLPEAHKSLLSHFKEPIGVGVNAARAREIMKSLLEETQQQAEELQAQQEELRVNNEELEQQARVLETQTQELSRTNEYKSDFLAKMSHELRTPLNSLLILTTLLIENKEKNLNERQLEFAKSIHEAGNDLLDLITDILDLSKIEARKLQIRPEEFTVESLFSSLERMFKPQAEAKKLKLNVVASPQEKAIEIFTDRQRLEQIMKNFLVNAIKFTEKGEVTLSLHDSNNPEYIAIAVTDTGIGIPKHKQKQVFEAFEQADSSISRKFGGTGLGLTISRELAALLGGKVSVQSEEGKGSTFIVSFRRKMTLSPEQAAESQDQIVKVKQIVSEIQLPDNKNEELQKVLKEAAGKSRTILIVEDDTTFSRSVADAARSHGFNPVEIADGQMALSFLQQFTPTAIMLDIKLPNISGIGLLEIVKQMPNLRHVPIHMISALEYQDNALRMGAMGYLGKPVTIDKVRSAFERIEDVLSKNVKKVLLVEDDVRQRQAITELIGGPDIQVEQAGSAGEALTKITAGGCDCVIVDLQLPDFSGFELLDKLKSLESALPPIVIYTAREITREEEERLRKVSQSIIIKGAKSPERLLDEVNLFLHRVETLLPEDKRRMLSDLRSKDKIFQGKTVLVVDDDIRNVFALTSALEGQGFGVRIARDGIEALETLRAVKDIDVVLMDIMMPKMDGYQAIREVRKIERYKNVPIVALTAKAMKEDHEKCIQAGANDYLSKPINLGNLMSVLKVWLQPKGMFS